MSRSSMAPATEVMMPGPERTPRYHPNDCPNQPATAEPAIPTTTVTMIPPGSLPGMNNFANPPTSAPMTIIARILIVSSSLRFFVRAVSLQLAGPKNEGCETCVLEQSQHSSFVCTLASG